MRDFFYKISFDSVGTGELVGDFPAGPPDAFGKGGDFVGAAAKVA